MRSSRTITLFTEQSDFGQKPTSFLVSILVHGAAISLVGYGVLFMPRMDNRVVTKRYTVRQLDLQGQEQRSGGSAAGQIAYPGPHSAARESTSGGEQQAHSRRWCSRILTPISRSPRKSRSRKWSCGNRTKRR